jgi:UDP-N-acetylmuramoylalanine--D-glutamate ligase
VGNVGVSMIEAVLADPPYDVLAVELSSQQLHFAPSLAPAAGAILNLAPDHLDWHGTFQRYVEAKARMFSGAAVAIGNADDPVVARLLATCSATARVSFTLAAPGPDQFGVCAAQLVSRAFGDDGVVLIGTDAVRPPGQLNVANALAAAALARAQGVPAAAIADGLRRFVADPHRNQYLVTIDGVAYVDDSKATNAHAARGSLLAHQRIVWVAGGQLKGASVDELVAEVSSRLAAVVLLGADRAVIADAVRRHAPEIPLIEVANTDDRAMLEVVRAAAGLARPGDTVLLAPAGASYDMYANYSARGRAFEAAARELGEG